MNKTHRQRVDAVALQQLVHMCTAQLIQLAVATTALVWSCKNVVAGSAMASKIIAVHSAHHDTLEVAQVLAFEHERVASCSFKVVGTVLQLLRAAVHSDAIFAAKQGDADIGVSAGAADV